MSLWTGHIDHSDVSIDLAIFLCRCHDMVGNIFIIRYFLFYLFWGLLLPWTEVVVMMTRNEIVAKDISELVEAIFPGFEIE